MALLLALVAFAHGAAPEWVWAAAAQTSWPASSAVPVPVLTLAVTLWLLVNARRTASRGAGGRTDCRGCPQALHGLTVAQITDVHVGPTIRRGYLQAIVQRVNALAPDHGGHHRRPGGRPGEPSWHRMWRRSQTCARATAAFL
jgi:hypothetical protein